MKLVIPSILKPSNWYYSTKYLRLLDENPGTLSALDAFVGIDMI